MKKQLMLLLLIINSLLSNKLDAFFGFGLGGRRGGAGLYFGLGNPYWGGYWRRPYYYPYRRAYYPAPRYNTYNYYGNDFEYYDDEEDNDYYYE